MQTRPTPTNLSILPAGFARTANSTANNPQYLLYDGHGSTRQLINHTLVSGEVVIAEEYDYDGYGVAVGFEASTANTNLLYSGEQYDSSLSQYYLRARYYNQNNGRFNRMDPLAGNNEDPQSLHKYLYTHCNPINNIDPTGQFSLPEMLQVGVIVGCVSALVTGAVMKAKGYSEEQTVRARWRAFWIGSLAGAFVYGVVWMSYAVLTAIYGAGAGLGDLQNAQQYGIQNYSNLREAIKGLGLRAHHIIEKRFAQTIGMKAKNILSVAVTPEEHQVFTNAWRQHIPYITGTATATKEIIWEKAQIIYAEYPALLDAAKTMLGM